MPIQQEKHGEQYNLLVLVQLFIVLAGAPLFLFIDSPWLSPYFSQGQDVSNAIMVITYSSFLLMAKRRLFWLILLMTIASLFAEIIGSLLLGLYQYRFQNIPMYIPLGHALIFATIYQLCHQPIIWRNRLALEQCLGKFAFVTVLLSLFFLRDIAGFLCYILFLGILYSRKKPIFYLFMFAMVYYIELCGTVFSTWSWYTVLGNHPNLPSIGYTPSGVSGLYILIDLTSSSLYLYARKTKKLARPALRRLALSNRPPIICPEPENLFLEYEEPK